MKVKVLYPFKSRTRAFIDVIGILAGLFIMAAPCIAQEDMRVVDKSVFVQPVRSPALFEHDVHNDQAELDDCAVCHHLYEDGVRLEGESSEDQQCVECHAEVVDAHSVSSINLRRAYHLRCKGCHLSSNSGPIMCAECHKK